MQTANAFVSHILDNMMLGDAIPLTTQPMEQQVKYVPINNEPQDKVVEIFDDQQQEQALAADNRMVFEEKHSIENPITKPSEEEPMVNNKSETNTVQPPAVVFVDETTPLKAGKTAEFVVLFPPVDDWDDESDNGASVTPTPKAMVQSELENVPVSNEFRRIMEPLFSLSGITQGDENAINAVIEVLASITERMRYRGFSSNDYTPMIIESVQRQLDLMSQSMWNRYQKGKPLTLDLFMDFLTERVKNILPKEVPSPANQLSQTRRMANRDDHTFFHGDVSMSNETEEAHTMKCPRCETDHHPLHRCAQFISLTWRARLDTVKRINLCQNCFSRAHKAKDCKNRPCKECGMKHNNLLCPITSFFDPNTKL